jgi:hypothetical protein
MHTILIVTCVNLVSIKASHSKARELFNMRSRAKLVSSIHGTDGDGYWSFCIFSDGSKPNSTKAIEYLAKLDEFDKYLHKKGNGNTKWTTVRY